MAEIDTGGDLNEYAKALIRRWESSGRTLTSLAEALGLSVGFLSQVKTGRSKMGLDPLERLAALHGYDIGTMKRRARAYERGEDDSRVEYDEPDRPRFGSLPGWAEAEAQARRMARGTIPEEAWQMAADAAGARTPVVTPLFVLELARAFAGAMASEEDGE